MDNQNMVYMAYDGDNAGRLCGRAILADNPDALHEVSGRIQLGHEVVKRWVEAHGGQFISGGGDEGVFSIPIEAIANVEELRADYQYATNLTTTIGIGKTLSEAGKAMLVGKFRGKNMVVQFEPAIEQEIKQAQAHIAGGTGSQEENKIGEAYLQPEGTVSTMQNEMKSEGAAPAAHDDCPYCNEMDAQQVDDPNHCRYCHDAEAQAEEPCPYCATPHAADSGHPDDCPYCAGMAAHDPAAEGHPDDCPYCASSASRSAPAGGDDQSVTPTAGPTVNSPTTTDSQNYAGQDLNQPDLPKPDAIQAHPDGLGSTIDSPTNENVKLEVEGQGANHETTNQAAQAADPQSEETAESIAQQLTQTPVDAQTEAPAQEPIDAANLAADTTMQENVSRPPDYDNQNRPADMGLGEEEQGSPDIGGLMQEGLDSHADSIQREKVITLVSEALEGFKACKGIIEKAKVQAPQLYESSIAMLKAMIEMAKMMGLDKEAGSPDGNDPLGDGAASADGHPEYENADGEGAAGGDHPEYEQAQEKPAEGAPEKKSEGAVGQPIGKLPTSQTTKHIARTPQFPGATNAKGQKKVIDPVTGKVRWIDMKEGKVQSPTGVPVKPAEVKQEGETPKEPKPKK